MAQFIACVGRAPSCRGFAFLGAYKELQCHEVVSNDWCTLATIPRNGISDDFAIDQHTQRWLVCMGTWFHPDASDGSSQELLRLVATKGITRLAQELEGFFAVIVGDDRARRVSVITDRCGSCHVFSALVGANVWICTSSAAVAAVSGSGLDPIGVHQFLATGVIAGQRTLWSGVTKLRPACIYTTDATFHEQTQYWGFEQLTAERYDIDVACQRVGTTLVQAASRIGQRFKRVACDVTGGYDSRACLTAFLTAGVEVTATVGGDEKSADVRISREIASALGLRHVYTGPAVAPTVEDLRASARLTDGEYDAFEYSHVRRTHLELAKDHDVSINGSFGELARGYWWELLFPRIGRCVPLDVRRVAIARFTAGASTAGMLKASLQLDLQSGLESALADAVRTIRHLPNTSQLDAVYYFVRMQRWQGRIASATHQIWPCLSPFSFGTVLAPVLEAKARARMGSRLIRTMIDQQQPRLAAISLEYGHPAQPLRTSTVLRFAPFMLHFGQRAVSKAFRIAARRLPFPRPLEKPARSVGSYLDQSTTEQLNRWLTEPLLLDSALFDEPRLRQLFTGAPTAIVHSPPQRRLVTLEILLRELAKLRLLRHHSSEGSHQIASSSRQADSRHRTGVTLLLSVATLGNAVAHFEL